MKKLLISILPIAIFLLVYSCKKGEVVQDVKSLGNWNLSQSWLRRAIPLLTMRI